MLRTHLLNRSSLPRELKAFLLDYPRKGWSENPNFQHFSEFWLQRHEMFRELSAHLIFLSQTILNKEINEDEYQKQTRRYSSFMLQQLHLHHEMEDNYFFPGIAKYDKKLIAAIELLETDHSEISALVDAYEKILKRCITPKETLIYAGNLLECQSRLNKALKRHLEDEEDIIVPAALHYGYRR